MKWTETDLASLALARCAICHGAGIRRYKKEEPVPCRCCYRAAFRACFARFKECVMRGKFRSRVSFDRHAGGRSNRGMWGRKEEEFMADFEIVARRNLDAMHYKLFRYHFLLGADWKLCTRRLGISRGNFFHAVYRIEEKLGYTFANLEPYALYPPRDYFTVRTQEPVKPSNLARRSTGGGTIVEREPGSERIPA